MSKCGSRGRVREGQKVGESRNSNLASLRNQVLSKWDIDVVCLKLDLAHRIELIIIRNMFINLYCD